MVEKVGFTNCVFEKMCFPENTIFIVFSAKHSFSKTKTVCWKNRKFMKNSGLFLNMAKWCFGGLFFEVILLLIKRFVFGVSGIVSKVLKMLVFPNFWKFLGWLIVVHLALEGLGVFVFLVFVLLFCFAFVSVLFALLLVFVVGSCCFAFWFFIVFFWRV